MESQLHHATAILGRACNTVISAKPIYLDQSLCSGLADCLKFAAEQLTEVRNEIESVVQEYPDLFRELNIVACRAHVLVERCCTEEWLRILFLQACTSHKEDAFDVIDDLEWCMVEIWKISRLPRQQCQSLLRFKESLEEFEDSDRRSLSKQLKSHGLVLMEYECLDRRELLEQSESDGLLPLVKRELQLTKYLLGRIEVLGVSSTPGAVEASLDYRNLYPTVANGFTDSVLLGQGSAAKVYKTKFLGMQCAKKVQTAITAGELQGLAEQASKLAPLSHPHVMKLLGFHADKRIDEGIYEGHWLMECMDGDLVNSIRQCLNQFSTAEGVMLQIAKGVRYLHENGIAHRDLKCGNILVNKSSVSRKVSTSAHNEYFHIKVTDFDQSKFLRSNCSDLQVQSKPNVGSSPWRAPEAFTERGKGSVHLVNPKSADSYSFAMTCFELLSGENPFDAMPGISWTKAKEALIAGRRPSLPEDWPELFRELIAECWRTNPLQRPAFPEICRRLLDVRAFLLTGSLTHRKRQRDAPSFLRHNAQRVFSVFKNVMRMAVTPTRYVSYSLTMSGADTMGRVRYASPYFI
jgi:serine/threonine protein kinase